MKNQLLVGLKLFVRGVEYKPKSI